MRFSVRARPPLSKAPLLCAIRLAGDCALLAFLALSVAVTVCPLGLCSLFGTELRDRECVAGELLQQGNQAGNMCMYKEYVGMGRECMDGVRSSCIRIIMY